MGVQGSGGASSWASWEARTSNAQRKASGWLSARELSCQRESSTPMSSACSRYLVARETLEYRDAEPRGDGAGDDSLPSLSALNLSCSRGVCLCTRFITSDLTPWLAAT